MTKSSNDKYRMLDTVVLMQASLVPSESDLGSMQLRHLSSDYPQHYPEEYSSIQSV